MKIYIAGPYTKGDVAQNVKAAVLAANNIAALGHVPYCPHLTHFWHMIYPRTIEFWYAYDLEWLKVCNALFRLPGESAGADNEERIAREMGLPIFTHYSEIPKA